MKYPKKLIVTCSLALIATGAFAHPVLLKPVGPVTETLQASDYVGTLIVFTATEERPDGDNTYRYPHTSYEIYRDGHPFRKVDNGQSQLIEEPDQVVLPKGNYMVLANGGTVEVPVRIETGRKTVVRLDD